MRRTAAAGVLLVALGGAVSAATPDTRHPGRQPDGSVLTTSNQTLRPLGPQIEFDGRPNAVAVQPGGQTAALLTDSGTAITVVDLARHVVLQRAASPARDASFTGLVYSRDGRRLFGSFTGGDVVRWSVSAAGALSHPTLIPLPPVGHRAEQPGGLALSADGRWLYVALNRSNGLGVIDLAKNHIVRRYEVGNAPYGVAVVGDVAVVTNRGGRRARPGERTNRSDGTPIVSTPTSGGVATGTVSFVSLRTHAVTEVRVGLQPGDIALRGRYAFVTNSNSDTISVLDVPARRVVTTIAVRPFPGAPYGSAPNAVTPLGADRLVVTLGRNNALAVYHWVSPAEPAVFEGLLPTGWYPADVVVDAMRGQLVVANDKGVGALGDPPVSTIGVQDAVTVRQHRGSVSLIPYPTADALRFGTATVSANNAWNDAAASRAKARAGTPAVAIPQRIGEPSLIKHVFYVIKENRTYDQVLGDDPRGNGDPRYLQFGATVTPNQHQLAVRFPLFDNFYVSGTLSPDGHQWAMQAFVTDYLERSFGDFSRGYSYSGGDALTYAPTGFLWENAQRHGRSVRVYGEFANHKDGSGTRSDVPSLDKVLVRRYPRFDLGVADSDRMKILLDDLSHDLVAGTVPDLTIVQLPLDHTHGVAPDKATPESDVSDNDSALGLLAQTLSESAIWKDTAVFVVEDDAQAGLDHVDGHRTTAFVVSPYARTGLVDSTYYTQINMVRTIEQILGLPPMNQMDLAAQPMTTAFTDSADATPFVALPQAVPWNTNPPIPALSGIAREWAEACARMNFRVPDAVPEQLLNRAIWYGVKGFVPYPGDGAVLTPAQVTAKFGAASEDEGEREVAGTETDDRDGEPTLSATGLGGGVAACGLLLCAVAAVARRRARAWSG